MKTMEQILNEIQNAMTLNKNNVAKCNVALSDAKGFIMHEEKELQNRLEEEYKRGMNDAWEIAREIIKCNDTQPEIFNGSSIEYLINTSSPIEIRNRISSYKEELNKVHIGDIVRYKSDGEKAVVLDSSLYGKVEYGYWSALTENGEVVNWHESDFTKTGENVDIHNIIFKS